MCFIQTIKQVIKKMFSSRKQTAAETVSQLNTDITATETHKCPELYPCLVCFMDETTSGKPNGLTCSPNTHKCPEIYPCLVCLTPEDLSVDRACHTGLVKEQQTNYRELEKSQTHEALRQFFARRGRRFVPKLHWNAYMNSQNKMYELFAVLLFVCW